MSSQSAAADLAPRSAARFVRDKSRAATQHYTAARPLLGSAAGFVADRWLACSSRTREKLRKWPYQTTARRTPADHSTPSSSPTQSPGQGSHFFAVAVGADLRWLMN
jgi:hypothetical protein